MQTTTQLTLAGLALTALVFYQSKAPKTTVEGEIVHEVVKERVFPNLPVRIYHIKNDKEAYVGVFENYGNDPFNVGDKVKVTLGAKVSQTYDREFQKHGRKIVEYHFSSIK